VDFADVGAQSTIAGGGRYDALFEQLGGKPTPACGFAFGIERVILAMESAGVKAAAEVGYFIAHAGEAASTVAFKLAEDLREKGNTVLLGTGGIVQVAVEKGRCPWGALCAHHRR
jgi:histidyl-tRNA synthetase